MPTTERKYTPAENKARRLNAAEAEVERLAKAKERADARVTEAETLKTKADEAGEKLTAAENYRDWLRDMPVPGETPEAATVEGTEDQDEDPAPAEMI